MKKFLSLALTMAILLACVTVGAITASAQSFQTSIRVGSTTYVADIGDTFSYTVSLKSDRPLATGQFELPVNFAYLSGESEDDLNAYITQVMPVTADTGLVQRFDTASASKLKGYVLNFATAGRYDFTTQKVAFTLNFTVLKAGAITLEPKLVDFIDANGNDMIDVGGKVVSGNIESAVTVSLPKQNSYSVKAPLIKSFANNNGSVRITWGAVDGAAKYRVFRKNNGKWATLGTVATTYYDDKNVVSGKTYSYTVRCMDANGKNFTSDYVSTGWDHTYYSYPPITAFESAQSGLKLSWNALDGVASYRVYRKNNGKWTSVGVVKTNSFTDKNVESGTQYTYTVRCQDVRGALISAYNTTGYSAYYLGSPVVTSVANGYGGVTVKWNKINGAEKYRVFRKTADTGWSKLVDTTAVSYNDKTAKSDTTYYYTVRCISADAKKYTSPYDTVGKSVHYIAAPVIAKFENTAAGTVISWNAVDGADTVRVFRKNGTSWKKLADTSALTYTDTNVKSGTAYEYTLRCVDDKGSFISGYNSTGWSNTYLSAPTVTSVTNNVGYVRVNWAKMTGAVKYRVFRKTGTGGWTKLGDTTGVYYNDKTAVSGTKYSYTVRCISADGKAYTSPFNSGKSITYIAAPTLKSVAKVTGGVKFTWAKSTGAAKYRVFRKTGSGSWVKMVDTTALNWTDKTVKSGTKYTYTVRCITADGKSFTSAFNTTGLSITYK